MPKDIIIIITIIINIIIIIKALTGAQGLEAKAEEYQAGIAAEGTASPVSGSHHGVTAAPSLSRWNLCSQSSAARGWRPCPVPQSPPKALLPAGSMKQLCLPRTFPSSPIPHGSGHSWPWGRHREQAGRAPWHPLGCSQAVPAHGSFSFHGISSGAPRMPDVQQNSSTNPWKIKTLLCLQSGPQSH